MNVPKMVKNGFNSGSKSLKNRVAVEKLRVCGSSKLKLAPRKRALYELKEEKDKVAYF